MPQDNNHKAIEFHFDAAAKVAMAAEAVRWLWLANKNDDEYRRLYNQLDDGERWLQRKARELY